MSSGQPVGSVKSFADLPSLLAAKADRILVSAPPSSRDDSVTPKPVPSLDVCLPQQVCGGDLSARIADDTSVTLVERSDAASLKIPYVDDADDALLSQEGAEEGASSLTPPLLQDFAPAEPIAFNHAFAAELAPSPYTPDAPAQQVALAEDAAKSGRYFEIDRDQPDSRKPVSNEGEETREDPGDELLLLRSNMVGAEAELKRLRSQVKKLAKARNDEKQRAGEFCLQYESERKKAWELKREVRELRAESDTAAELLGKTQRQASKFRLEAERLRRDIDILQARPDLLVAEPALLEWLVQDAGPACIGLGRRDLLGWTGTGPYPATMFDALLERLGLQQHDLADEAISHVVVGRIDWSQELLERQVELRRGKTLRVYSQEMLVAALITGRDPLDSGADDVLECFKRDSDGLQFLAGDSLEWPAFSVPASFPPPPPPLFGLDESPLRLLGYVAGKTMGLPDPERRRVLRRGFEVDQLPRPKDATDVYMAAWGHSRMPRRLWRIAHHLASLASFHSNKPVARAHWISDLAWLYDAIYMPRDFRFVWPEVSVTR